MESLTICGLIATTPRHLVTQDGLPITSFRIAASQRWFDRKTSKWADGETNWYTVTAFRQLAINMSQSFAKGDRVVISGRVRVRDWDNGERAGTTVEVEATAAGHDLAWGNSAFTRNVLVREAAVDDETIESGLAADLVTV